MAGEANVNPIWKQAAMVLVAILVTGGTAWLTFGGDKVTVVDFDKFDRSQRQYVAEQISKAASESDYTRERGVIRIQLDNNTKNVATLTEQIQAVVRAQSDAAADQKITNAKLDALSAQVAAIGSKLDEVLRRGSK